MSDIAKIDAGKLEELRSVMVRSADAAEKAYTASNAAQEKMHEAKRRFMAYAEGGEEGLAHCDDISNRSLGALQGGPTTPGDRLRAYDPFAQRIS